MHLHCTCVKQKRCYDVTLSRQERSTMHSTGPACRWFTQDDFFFRPICINRTSNCPLGRVLTYKQHFRVANLPEEKYIPPATGKWYKMVDPCFEEKMQDLNRDYSNICTSCKPSEASRRRVSLQIIKEFLTCMLQLGLRLLL